MSGTDGIGATATDTGGACGDCALADGPGCCGGHGTALVRSDRAVLAMAGLTMTLIVLAVLTVDSSRHPLVLVPAGVTLAATLAVGGLGGAAATRIGGASDRAAGLALRVLPFAVSGVLLTAGAALIRLATA